MPKFILLADSDHYSPCTQDMLTDMEFRTYWLDHFLSHFDLIARLAEETYGPQARSAAAAAKQALALELQQFRSKPERLGELNLEVLGRIRQDILQAHNIPDPFKAMKDRENTAMLGIYPRLIGELDQHARADTDLLLLLIEGVFAGNIFDLGASATAARFSSESPDFVKIRANLAHSRPWLVDDLNEFSDRLLRGHRHAKALFFLDNAGSDAILGVIPLVRWLAKRGTQVHLLANEEPALNDLTYSELCDLLPRLATVDPVLRDLLGAEMIIPGSSGGRTPLIDLRTISPHCNAVAAGADLLFLEGMGRGLESNFNARFTVDTVKLCMIKEPIIAQRHHGQVFDVVLRFDAAGSLDKHKR